MSGGFVKLYSSMLLSSVWMESKDVRILWVTMLTMSDPRGIVDASIPGLANAANLTLPECKVALETLMSPDEYSKSPTKDGRRVEKVDRGWLIINYEEYRERRSYGDSDDCYVYYAVDGDAVKIGTSKNPWARASEFRTARPNVVIAAVERGGRELESERHKQFAGHRVTREWFTLSPEISAHIGKLQPVEPKAPNRLRTERKERVQFPFKRETTEVTTTSDVGLPEGEGEAEAYAEPSTTTTPTSANEILESVAMIFPKPGNALAMLRGMMQGLGTTGMRAVDVDLLHEAAIELSASEGAVTPHRFKIFVDKIQERRARVVAENPRSRNDGARRGGKTLAASELIARVRRAATELNAYSGMMGFPQGWESAFSPSEIRVIKAFKPQRILNETNDGTLVSQIAKALEEAA